MGDFGDIGIGLNILLTDTDIGIGIGISVSVELFLKATLVFLAIQGNIIILLFIRKLLRQTFNFTHACLYCHRKWRKLIGTINGNRIVNLNFISFIVG